MSSAVLDASAFLCLLQGEPGADTVRRAIRTADAVMSAVNLAEVASKLAERGSAPDEIAEAVAEVGIEIVPLDETLAMDVGMLRPLTRAAGLSLGDRACLATARRMGARALTTDGGWAGLQVGVEIVAVRQGGP